MMTNLLELAQKKLLAPTDLDAKKLTQLLKTTLGPGINWSDIFFQASQSESWTLEDGIVKQGTFTIDQGAGIRAICGDKTGLAYVDDLRFATLREAAQTARGISRQGQSGVLKVRSQTKAHKFYSIKNPITEFSESKKIALLQALDAEARRLDRRVYQVAIRLAAAHNVVLICASDGTLAADVRPMIHLGVSLLIKDKNRRESGSSGGGARAGYEYFLEEGRAFSYVHEALRIAQINLRARHAPAGSMPVVLGAGWPAVMVHEAIGHGLEGDFNRRGSSNFSGKIGAQIASPLCNIVDNGALSGKRRGSLNIDDEGTKTQCTTLVEKGVLKQYMFDKLNAELMHTKSTGNGRRASYAAIPIPRMTNTYMLPGTSDPKEIIASVKNGIYAVNFSGGQVDITSGEFVFAMNEAYLIRNGKVTHPVKGATLIGNGPEVLSRVTMVGNDLAFDAGVGTCGKDGQSVPVGVGQPTLKIDHLTVGGTR